MEEYTVRIQGDTLLALHGEQAIYRGKVIKEQGKMMFHLENGTAEGLCVVTYSPTTGVVFSI